MFSPLCKVNVWFHFFPQVEELQNQIVALQAQLNEMKGSNSTLSNMLAKKEVELKTETEKRKEAEVNLVSIVMEQILNRFSSNDLKSYDSKDFSKSYLIASFRTVFNSKSCLRI